MSTTETKPLCDIALLNRVYRMTRFKVGQRVMRVVPSNDPTIDDKGHIGVITAMFFGDTNVFQIQWQTPNIARWLSRSYGSGLYLIAETVDPFHVTPLQKTRGLPDWAGDQQ